MTFEDSRAASLRSAELSTAAASCSGYVAGSMTSSAAESADQRNANKTKTIAAVVPAKSRR
jgi:hypothetical protein